MVTQMRCRTYTELLRLPTFEDRLRYASIGGEVGGVTFGGHRILNQDFYRSSEWKRVRDFVLVRDNGRDLAIPDRLIVDKIIVHHLNPIMVEDLGENYELLLDPEFLVCVSHETHNLIHYGVEEIVPVEYHQRFQNDTCPWKLT